MFIIDDLILFVGLPALTVAGGANALAGGLRGAEARIERFGERVQAETREECEASAEEALEQQAMELHRKYGAAMDKLEEQARADERQKLLRIMKRLTEQ